MLECISITKVPKWVNLVEIPGLEKNNPYLENFTEGYYTLLVDRQKNLTDKNYSTFFRFVFQIHDIKALSLFNSIQIDFQPPKEQLQLHHINVIRNNKVIKKLSLSKISIFRREQGLEENIITGEHTCHHMISGLQIGDKIDYAYTYLWNEEDYINIGPRDIFQFDHRPVLINNYRVLWPIDKPHFYKTTQPLPLLVLDKKDHKEIRVIKKEPSLHNYEINSPPSERISGIMLSMSSLKDWSAIVEWGVRSYTYQGKLSKDLNGYIQNLSSKYTNAKDQIMQALDFCSNEIAYTSHEEGLPWNCPNKVNIIFKRRYGDCKDKVYLFITILRALGIEAHPALVNTQIYEGIEKHCPQNVFDHVIAYIRADNEEYWLDPTLQRQGKSLSNIGQTFYGKALLLREGEKDLIACQARPYKYPEIEIKETFDPSNPGYIIFNIHTQYRYHSARRARQSYHNSTSNDYKEHMLSFIRKYYNDAEFNTDLMFNDDYNNNIVTVQESYKIKYLPSNEPNVEKLHIYFTEINRVLFQLEFQARKYPFLISHPEFIKCEQSLLFNDKINSTEEEFKIENPNFIFIKQTKVSEGNLLYLYEYQALKDRVEPEELEQYVKDNNATCAKVQNEIVITTPPLKKKKNRFEEWIKYFLVGMAIMHLIKFLSK